MKILVNFQENERHMLPVLSYFIKSQGYTAISTAKVLTISQLIDKAKAHGCQGIFLVNAQTLANCVPGTRPTLDLYRGSRLDYSVPVIVGNSLLQINSVIHGRFILETDLAKFKRLSLSQTKEFSFSVLDETHKFPSALSQIEQSLFVAYDIETVTLSPEGRILESPPQESLNETDEEANIYDVEDVVENGHTVITCAAFTCFTTKGEFITYVLPFWNFLSCHWPSTEEYVLAHLFLKDACETDVPKAMHNGQYDCLHSIAHRIFPRNFCIDTMGMAHAQYCSLPKSLDFVASLVLPDFYQWKPQAKEASSRKDINQYWEYNAKDTFYTARIALHYLRHLPAYARRNYAEQFKLVYPCLYCAFEGFAIDQSERSRLKAEREILVEKQLEELQIILDDKGDISGKKKVGFNPSSPKQVQYYLYDVLGAKDPHIGFKKVNGKRTRIVRGTDAKNLSAIGEQHPILAAVTTRLTSYRENRKAISTYFNFIQREGRLLYHLDPFGTETERMASKKSSFWCGTQVQNIPQYAKTMLIADPGYTICEPDNSQSEARCTAYLAQDLALIQALETPGKDFYTSLGTLFFGMEYEKVTKEFRNKVLKKIVHGTNYMMKEQTFIENAGVDNLLFAALVLGVVITPSPTAGSAKLRKVEMTMKSFAGLLLEKYHEPFQRIRKWYQEVKNEISATHMLRSPLGHVRWFFGDPAKHYQTFASAIAHGPQNLSVTIVNIGWWKLWEMQKREPIKLRMKAQVHDSAPFQYMTAYPEIRDEAIQCFRNPVTIHGRILRIPVDYKEGPSWGETIERKAQS